MGLAGWSMRTRSSQLVEIDVRANLSETHPRRPAKELAGVTCGDHRLRRDAIPQMSGPADRVALDHDHVRTQARRSARATVARRSPSDDHHACRH